MNPAHYTPDAICHSMGLPAFIEPEWSPPTLRLLLKPSFDPEVCITLAGPADNAQLSVVALTEMLWRQPGLCVLAARRERADLPAPLFDQAIAGFDGALAADRLSDERMMCLDGMPVAACLLTGVGLEQFACSPYRPEVSEFVASLTLMAWENCRTAGVRNALAACGRYVGLDLPQEPVPPTPELACVAVIGTPDARAEFFGQLQQR